MIDLVPPADAGLQEAIGLVWREADLLDRCDYAPWLDLWSEAGLYIVPTEPEARDYAEVLNFAYDDAHMRRARVKRLTSGYSMSAAPPARTVRTVSRFVVEAKVRGFVELRCGMILAEYKYERTRVLAADIDYRLVREGGDLRIDRKVVKLVNAADHLYGLGYLL